MGEIVRLRLIDALRREMATCDGQLSVARPAVLQTQRERGGKRLSELQAELLGGFIGGA